MRLSHYLAVFYNKYYPPTVINRYSARKRNKNLDFSLLCGNCMAGILYNKLGLEFRSPTVNMRIFQNDFYKILMNLNKYLNSEVVQVDDVDGCPAGKIDDVLLTFTHFHSFEDGVSAWNRRKKKINMDNLWIIMTDRDGITEKEIASLNQIKCRGLVVFTSKKYDYPYCFYMPEFQNCESVGNLLKKTILGKMYFEKFFDWVGWLNSNDPIAEHYRIK